jgi:hypothetical protein
VSAAKEQLYLVENKKRLNAQVSAELEKYIQSTPARKLPLRVRKALFPNFQYGK